MSSQPLRILITGATGQLGLAFQQHLPAEPFAQTLLINAVSRAACDLSDANACREIVEKWRPDWLINAGAYTAVDRAESEYELANAVNALAPQAFAKALQSTGGRLLQISTDFVFAGHQGKSYLPGNLTDPIGVYGITKAAGEAAAAEILDPERLCIMRTSWLYGPKGKNFLLNLLRLHSFKADAGEALGVVADQIGCPTATKSMAAACWAVVERELHGIHHWSDAGVASWYDFAMAIGELGVANGLLKRAAMVKPITTADYPTAAPRPSFSLLDCTDTRKALHLPACHWRQSLEHVIGELKNG